MAEPVGLQPTIEVDGEVLRRFRKFLKVDLGTGCLLWKGGKTKGGHPLFWLGGRMVPATHVALAIAGRSVPSKHRAYHACPAGDPRPWCVNPRHLVVETPAARKLRPPRA